MRNRLLPAALLLIALPARAQTIWNVEGQNGSNNLVGVIAQAAPGDVLVFDQVTGQFPPFSLNKGLKLIGPAVIARNAITEPDSVLAIPTGQRARLVEVYFGGLQGQATTMSGDISLEDCRFGPRRGVGGQPARALTFRGGTLIMRDTIIFARLGGGGIEIAGGSCSLTHCLVAGAQASGLANATFRSSSAIAISGGLLVATDLSATGGQADCAASPAGPMLPPSPAVTVEPLGRLHLSDSSLTGGSGFPVNNGPCQLPGAAAIAATHNVLIARTGLSGGSGMPPGPGITGAAQLTDRLVGLGLDLDWRLGQTTTATATAGTSQQLLAIVGGFDATASTLPFVVGPVFGIAAPPILLATAVPASGAQVAHAIAVPNLTALLHVEMWLQALQLDGATILASGLAGGLIL